MNPEPLGLKRYRFPIFTVGHSAHLREHFKALLVRFSINVVLDVRSSPYSRRYPQYNRNALKGWLLDIGIQYTFAGSALGGRPTSPSLYVNGKADYLQMAESTLFREGLRRVATAARSYRVVLMCAEADPLECHRFLLIGRALHEGGLDVQHILPSGGVERHAVTEDRLLRATGVLQRGFFDDGSDALARAYILQAARAAYSVDADRRAANGKTE